MIFFTDFADQAVLFPVACTIFAGLLLIGWRRGALAWAAGVGGVLALMLLLKLLVFACGSLVPWAGLSSPSGHTATAAIVYGGLLSLFLRETPGGLTIAAAAAAGFALVFGFSRLALGVHTVPDVLVGGIVGIAGTVALRLAAGRRPAHLPSPRLAAAALAVMLLFHGHRLQAETRIRWLALDLWPLDQCAGARTASVGRDAVAAGRKFLSASSTKTRGSHVLSQPPA